MKKLDVELVKRGHPIEALDGARRYYIGINSKDKDYPICTCDEGGDIYTYTFEGRISMASSSPKDLILSDCPDWQPGNKPKPKNNIKITVEINDEPIDLKVSE